MAKISALTERKAASMTGAEKVPVAVSDVNFSISADELKEYASGVYEFDHMEAAGSIDPQPDDGSHDYDGSNGVVVYLTDKEKFAVKVAPSGGSVVYYLGFSGMPCHKGTPKAGKLYLCKKVEDNDAPSIMAYIDGVFVAVKDPEIWLTEDEYDALGNNIIEGVTYITYEEA